MLLLYFFLILILIIVLDAEYCLWHTWEIDLLVTFPAHSGCSYIFPHMLRVRMSIQLFVRKRLCSLKMMMRCYKEFKSLQGNKQIVFTPFDSFWNNHWCTSGYPATVVTPDALFHLIRSWVLFDRAVVASYFQVSEHINHHFTESLHFHHHFITFLDELRSGSDSRQLCW